MGRGVIIRPGPRRDPPGLWPLWWRQRGSLSSMPTRINPASLIAYTKTTFNDATTPKNTLASLTWLTNDHIVVLGISEDQSTTIATPTATGLTFTPVGSAVSVAARCWAHSWEAIAGSDGSSVITASLSAGTLQYGISVWQFRGSDGSGIRATDTTTAKTVSLARADNHSRVVEILGDFSADTITGRVWTPTGETEREAQQSAAHYTVFVADWPDQGDAAATSYGITGTTSVGDHTKIALEILGNFAVSQLDVTGQGIPSDQAIGNAVVAPAINADGISSSESVGSPTITTIYTITANGIPSSEVSGNSNTATITNVAANGIPTEERLGQPTVTATYTIQANGIPPSESVGSSTVNLTVPTNGITSSEALGNPTITVVVAINAGSIASQEVFGAAAVTTTYNINTNGIVSDERIGLPNTSTITIILAGGIVSAESVGKATTTPGAVTISASGIKSEEISGHAQVSLGALALFINSNSIFSAEMVGFPYIGPQVKIDAIWKAESGIIYRGDVATSSIVAIDAATSKTGGETVISIVGSPIVG